jgi:hypothetical protein
VRGLFDPNKKGDKNETSTPKKKKNESTLKKKMPQTNSQEQRPGSSPNENETKPVIAGSSVVEWLRDQPNGNEFKSEYVIPVPESFFEIDEVSILFV